MKREWKVGDRFKLKKLPLGCTLAAVKDNNEAIRIDPDKYTYLVKDIIPIAPEPDYSCDIYTNSESTGMKTILSGQDLDNHAELVDALADTFNRGTGYTQNSLWEFL